jgi:hypothetical protein
MLISIVGATYLSLRASEAAEPLAYAPGRGYAAVDGVNGKVGGLGGTFGGHPIYAGKGSLTIPLDGAFGMQIDGIAGSWDDRAFGAVGGHLFWRNPAQALIGIYANHTRWDRFGGVHVSQVAAEAEYYLGRFTLQGLAGVEFGNRVLGPATTVALGAGVAGNFGTIIDIKTRFFDKVNLAYYFTDNWKSFVGHRYLGGKHSLALGTEYGWALGGGRLASAFVEGRIGGRDNSGVWGGLKLYLGRVDKPLIARHRQDDPEWDPDTLFTIENSTTNNGLQSTQTAPAGGGDGDGDGPDGDGE